jgi:hypothetical protein
MFTISNEQKKTILESARVGTEMEIYQMLVILNLDPDTYDLTKILELEESVEPSTEQRLYTAYTKYKMLTDKIATL